MAGIGFELKKIISENSISSFFKASASGIFIVSGPWLLSILTLSVISLITANYSNGIISQFFGILVYVNAFSLIITGGLHYIITRIFSDYIFEKRVNYALSFILINGIFIAIITFILTMLFLVLASGLKLSNMTLSLIIAFQVCVTNFLWIILIFVTYLKWYKNILLSFIAGIVLIIICLVTESEINLNNLLMYYTFGNFLTLLSLISISCKSYKPERISSYEVIKVIMRYFSKYKYLLLTGFFYYVSFWIDKILNWYFIGEYIDGLKIKLLTSYDLSMYIANLTIIPGMVFFIINTETSFFIGIKKFILSLTISDYKTIRGKRNELYESSMQNIKLQSQLQFILSLSLSLISYKILPQYHVILIIAIWAVNFQLIVFTYMNFLFYLERYYHCFLIVFSITLINISLYFVILLSPINNIPGLSYLLANAFGVYICKKIYFYDASRIDRYIYSENSN